MENYVVSGKLQVSNNSYLRAAIEVFWPEAITNEKLDVLMRRWYWQWIDHTWRKGDNSTAGYAVQ